MSNKEIMELNYLKKQKRGLSREDVSSMAKWISLKERADSYFEGMRAMEKEIASRIVDDAEVVLATNSSAALEILDDVQFDVIITDEASQATLPSILIPLSKCSRFILAGDHKQLPPTIINKEAQELSITLFEILIKQYSSFFKLLSTQYRMNELLMGFPGKEFYKGKITASSGVREIKLSDLGVSEESSPLVFIDTVSSPYKKEAQKKDSFSYYNELEAETVKKIIDHLYKKGIIEEQFGIIAPYEDQVELLRKRTGVQAYTVDGYQGQEREIMILSFVRSNKEKNIGFLKDMRRLNVSLTRAKRKLIIIGDSETLSSYSTFKRYLDFIKEKGSYFHIKEEIIL